MKEKIESGYIFLDIKHPLVAWECCRGVLITPQSIEENKPPHPSVWLAGIIDSKNNSRLCNEFIFEYVRAKHFPSAVSRMSCLYVFKEKKDTGVAMDWGGSHFKNENLVKVRINANKISKVDSKWITYAALNEDKIIKYEYISVIGKYWNGEQYDDEPHWEYLIEGRAEILDEKIKEKAWEEINRWMPSSLGMLQIAQKAIKFGYSFGHVVPYIFKLSDNKYKLTYIIDANDLKSDSFWDEFDIKEFFLPNLTDMDKEFTLDSYKLYGLDLYTIQD